MKILVGVPCMATLPVEFVRSISALKAPSGCQVDVVYASMSLVYVAREDLVRAAISSGYDYVFFIDSDMVFERDVLIKLLATGKDIVTGLAFMRRPPYSPCVYSKVRAGDVENEIETLTEFNEVREIEGCGLACCLIKTEVFKSIREKSNCFTPMRTMGEDLTFCVRARHCGYKIFLNPDVKFGHLSTFVVSETTYRGWNE